MKNRVTVREFNSHNYLYKAYNIDNPKAIGECQYVYWLFDKKDFIHKIGITSNINTRFKSYGNEFEVFAVVKLVDASKEDALKHERSLLKKLNKFKTKGNEYLKNTETCVDTLQNYFFTNSKVTTTPLRNYPDYWCKPNSIHPESFKNARTIIKEMNNSHNLYVTKPTQSGKTSDLYATVLLLNKINPNNRSLIICGISDNSLRDQTAERMVYREYLGGVQHGLSTVEHYSGIVKIKMEAVNCCESINRIKNGRKKGKMHIFIDEGHLGVGENQRIPTVVQELKVQYPNIEFIITIITATPFNVDAVNEATPNSKFQYKHVALKAPKGYMGIENFLKQGRVKHIDGNLVEDEKIINKMFLGYYNKKLKVGFHIIRIHGKIHSAVKEYLNSFANIVEYDANNQTDMGLLEIKPLKPTIILVKAKLKAGITIHKEHVVSVWDNSNTISGIIQGLLGRLTGINCKYNKDLVIFTDKITAENSITGIYTGHKMNYSPGVRHNKFFQNSNPSEFPKLFKSIYISNNPNMKVEDIHRIANVNKGTVRVVSKIKDNSKRTYKAMKSAKLNKTFTGYYGLKKVEKVSFIRNDIGNGLPKGIIMVTRINDSSTKMSHFRAGSRFTKNSSDNGIKQMTIKE